MAAASLCGSLHGWMADKCQSIARWGWAASLGFAYLLGLCQQAASVLGSLRPRRELSFPSYPKPAISFAGWAGSS